MVVKSKGLRKRTGTRFRNPPKFTVNKFFREFKIGQKAAIVIDSSSSKGMPFRRFHGLTGKVIGKRGRSYILEISDGGKRKQVISRPEHLKEV